LLLLCGLCSFVAVEREVAFTDFVARKDMGTTINKSSF